MQERVPEAQQAREAEQRELEDLRVPEIEPAKSEAVKGGRGCASGTHIPDVG